MPAAIDLVVSTMLNAIALSEGGGARGGSAAGKKIGSQLLGNRKVISALLPKSKSWFIVNTDTQETVYGPYEPENVTHTAGSVYADAWALNKRNPIRQFLHGEVETITFTGRFYAVFELLEVEKKVNQLKEWSRKNEDLGRPPICYFFVGLDQHVKMESCIIRNVSVTYDKPGFLGAMKGATVNITIERYDPFVLTEVQNFDTRYHFAKLGDTFELIAAREYGNPMLGIQLRQNHPEHKVLQAGDIIKLPARGGSIRNAKREPSSIALKTVTRRKQTAQKKNFLRARKASRVSKLRYVTP